MSDVKKIVIVGSTGSIGRQTLEVLRSFPERFSIVGLTAGWNTVLLEEQVREFSPKYINFQGRERNILGARFLPLQDIVTLPEADIVLIAPAGIAGLKPTIWAAKAGKKIALANKESLVMAGDIIKAEIRKTRGQILPVDSEHSAIFQCLKGERKAAAKLILTASGGPFVKYTKKQLEEVTPEQALKHPSWVMGPKVTIDSATLLNKGLEIIEAHHLFGLNYNDIQVLVHPTSIVHSMVEFVDGSIKAQLSCPDMRFPIQYALSYPERWANAKLPRLDWESTEPLSFLKPDTTLFPCLKLAKNAGIEGGTYPAVLCGAGEAAVEMFLSKKITFLQIASVIEEVLNKHSSTSNPDINVIEEEADRAYKMAITIGAK
jgi:1-deoxy-D-xylulose-5-phosphate reductoisomerase